MIRAKWFGKAEEVCEKATPGPWWKRGKYQLYGPASPKLLKHSATAAKKGEKIVQARANQQYRWYGAKQDEYDIEFMVVARDALPRALKAIQELIDLIPDDAREEIDRILGE